MTEREDSVSSNAFSEEEQRSASDAYYTFLQGQFDTCISILKKIQKSHPGDFKLMHNRAIAEFYKSNQTKTGDLKKALSKVHKVTQQSHQEEDDLSEETSSTEYSVLHFNQALLCFYLHQYTEAQDLLQALVDNPEVSLNMREIYLLLVEVYLINYHPEKAVRLINKIEEAFLKPVSPQQAKQSGNDGKEKGKVQKNQGKDLKGILPLLKTRCCLQMKSMKACKRELKTFTNLESSSEMTAQTVQMLSVFLKSNFEFQRGNYHKAYKLLGSSPPSPTMNSTWLHSGESLSTMFYNNLGVIHFCTSKHNLGTFYLTKALEENDKAISTTVSKKGETKQQSSNVKTLQMLNMNKKFELLFNTGIQLLFSGKPSAAFDCLIVVVPVYYSNPRLWLRLAECCIQACCSSDKNEVDVPSSPDHKSNKQSLSNVPYSLVGSGIYQKLILHPVSQQWNGTGNSVMPGPTLEFASVCLLNALTILAEAGVTGIESKDGKKSAKNEALNKKSDISIPCFPSSPLSGNELDQLHASILANSAFVALSLGNNLIAYEYSKVLLQLPNLSGRHKYLGRMYSAEALISLDRISDAIHQLSSETVKDISTGSGDSGNKPQGNTDDPSSPEVHKPKGPKTTQTCFKSVQHAQGCMILNLAISHSLRSEFEKAQKFLTHFATFVPSQDVPPNAILLATYINLHTSGGLSDALKILQCNSLPAHSATALMGSSQNYFWPQQSMSVPGLKQLSTVGSPNGVNSNGFISGGSSDSRSISSTPQPQYSNPSSGSVTPERIVKSSKIDTNSAKTKRGRR